MDEERLRDATEKIREGLRNEGGDIEVVDYKEGVLYVRLKGRCKSCLLSGMTMKNWVEKLYRQYLPEIKEIREV